MQAMSAGLGTSKAETSGKNVCACVPQFGLMSWHGRLVSWRVRTGFSLKATHVWQTLLFYSFEGLLG